MPDLFKEIIPSILENKIVVLNSPEDDKSYVPFVVNKALSFHPDCILLANEMNQNPNMESRLQYHFLITTVRSWKRPFRKWMKLEKIADLDVIKKVYGVSTAKAREYLTILTSSELQELREKINPGGTKTTQK